MIRRFRTRLSLLRETAVMALHTPWANKLRSGLTVLGRVIGLHAVVRMAGPLLRFHQSLNDSIRSPRP